VKVRLLGLIVIRKDIGSFRRVDLEFH
jgi:hypothetical protein